MRCFYTVVLLSILIWFGSCDNPDSNTVAIGVLQGPSAMSFIKMIDENPMIDGKKINLIIKDEPQQIQAMMMQNKLDFAVLPTIMAANLYNKGVKYQMVACPVWGSLYIVSSDDVIKTIDDLNDKKIHIFGQGATVDILLQREIELNHLKNIQLDYTYTTNPDLAAALQQYIIRTAVVSEPLVSVLIRKNSKIHIVSKLNCEEFLGNSDKDIFAQTAFLVRKSLTQSDAQLVDDINDLYIQSCNYLSDEPANAAGLLVKHGFFNDTVAATSAIKLSNIRYVSAFAIEQEVNRYLNIFYEFNPESIGGKLPEKDFFYCKDF